MRAVAAAGAAHRAAPTPGGDGRGRAGARERARAADRRAPAVHADDRGARLPGPGRVAGRAGGEDRVLERLQGGRDVVGRAASVLTPRAAAGAAIVVALVAWYAVYERLPDVSTGADVAIVGAALLPATFALVWLALPL